MHPSFYEILISKVLSKEASADEIEQLENWLELSSENKIAFEEYKLIYKNQPVLNLVFDANSAFEKIEQVLNVKPSTPARFNYISIAASLILFISLGIFYFNSRHESKIIRAEWKTFTTGISERKSFKLSDESIIHLNSESSVKWRRSFDNESSREIILEGEAFFEVSPDSLRPFIVHTSNISTKVLGTTFNIDSNNETIRITVGSGSVGVKHSETETILSPGQQFTWHPENKKWQIKQVNAEEISAWRSGILVFENTKMDSAAAVLEKWYDTKILFQDNPIRACRITGRFKDEPLIHILDAIREATGIEYKIDNNQVKLMGTYCK